MEPTTGTVLERLAVLVAQRDEAIGKLADVEIDQHVAEAGGISSNESEPVAEPEQVETTPAPVVADAPDDAQPSHLS